MVGDMKNKFIILSVIFGLLLAGCTSQESPAPSAPSGTSAPSDTSGAGSVDNATSGTSGDSVPDTTGDTAADTSGTSDSGTPDSGGDVFSGLDYAGIMALGLPGKCEVTSTYNGQATSSTMYFDGTGKTRVESLSTDPQTGCSKFVIINTGSTVYIGCEGQQYPPGTDCDWMQMDAEGDSSLDAQVDYGEGGGLTTDYSNVPPSQISCVPWVADSGMFQASGKACTIQDLMQGYTP
jgi:hypothetical protein